MKKIAATFRMSHTVGARYNEGETAGFAPEVAEDLIKREIAKPTKADKAAKKPAEPELYAADDFKDEDEAVIDALIKKHKVTVAADAAKPATVAGIGKAKIAKKPHLPAPCGSRLRSRAWRPSLFSITGGDDAPCNERHCRPG